jgi:hypothetical protein
MSEFLPLDTKTGKVRSTSSDTGTASKPIDFTNVFVVGIGGAANEGGIMPLVNGQSYIDVTFDTEQTDNTWIFLECSVRYVTDPSPLNIWPGIITVKTSTGFRLQLNGKPDNANYFLNWAISGVNIPPPAPFPATTYIFTGPTGGSGGVVSSPFTVKLPPGGTVAGPVTVTPHDGGAGGTFTPATIMLTTGAPSGVFTYTPGSYGAKTISVTNDGGLTDPGNITYTVPTPSYTLTGPSTGNVGVASTNFTVVLSGTVIGTLTITPSSGGGGGTFTPSTVALTTGAPTATFTYTPSSGGTKTISTTNNGGLANPGSISYLVVAPFDPSTIAGLKLWLKADSLALSDGAVVATWTDNSGTANNATQTGTAQPVYKTNIVNGKPVVRFDGVNDFMQLATEITLSADFILYAVYKTTGDNCLVGAVAVNNQLFRVGEAGGNQLSLYDGVGGTLSGTLSVSRSSWNLGFIRRPPTGGYQFFDASGNIGIGGAGSPTLKAGVIGAVESPPIGLYTSGDVAEIILYDNQLASADVNAVRDYLKTKYAIP